MFSQSSIYRSLLLLALILGIGGQVSATVLNVPADFQTIQAAIDAAATGDEVVIAPGVYTGNGNRDILFKGKAITVRSIDPGDPAIVEATVIDCNGTYDNYQRAFIFKTGETNEAVLDGLHIVNGRADDGGGIICSGNSSPIIRRCVFRRNRAGTAGNFRGGGGAIAAIGSSSPVIDLCRFYANAAGRYGGAVCFGPPAIPSAEASAVVTRCVFAGNVVGDNSWLSDWPRWPDPYLPSSKQPGDGYGGGLYVGRGLYFSNDPIPPLRDSVTVSDCTFTDNAAGTSGGFYVAALVTSVARCTVTGNISLSNGGCYIYGTPADISDCLIKANSADPGSSTTVGAGGMQCSGAATVSSCDILGNGSGGLSCTGTSLITDCNIIGNSGSGLRGGGTSLIVRDCLIACNSSPDYGGGIYAGAAENVEIENCNIIENRAVRRGAGIYLANGYSCGEGLEPRPTGRAVMTVRGCNILRNSVASTYDSADGGGIACRVAVSTQWCGSPLPPLSFRLNVQDCEIIGNRVGSASSSRGGGIFIDSSTYLDVNISGCSVSENLCRGSSDNQGGGICVPAAVRSLLIQDCDISGNICALGPARASGGGIYAATLLTMSGCHVTDNRCGPLTAQIAPTTQAGGIWASSGTFTNCVIARNTSAKAAGMVLRSTADLLDCTIVDNVAYTAPGGIELRTLVRAANSIIRGNMPDQFSYPFVFHYCNVQGYIPPLPNPQHDYDQGTFDAVPCFVSNSDFHLLPDSPCIDSGTNTLPWSVLPPTDIDGLPRMIDGNLDGIVLADIGAYEYDPNAAHLLVSPDRIFFAPMAVNDPATQTQKVTLTTSGLLSAEWQIENPYPFLSISPSSGTTSGDAELTITASAQGLQPGFYDRDIIVRNISSPHLSQTVKVFLSVRNVIHVPDDYPTIQSAIDAAVPYDMVIVAPGTYTGDGNRDVAFLSKPIIVRSTDPWDPNIVAATIVDCQGTSAEPHRAFNMGVGVDNGAGLQGFTIINGVTSSEGAAIRCKNTSPTILNCVIRNCYGPGIYMENGDPVIAGCTISGCRNAIMMTNCNPIVRDCIISGNTAPSSGAGIYSSGSFNTIATIERCTVTANVAPENGGGIYVSGQSIIADCNVFGNSALRGGGMYSTGGPPRLFRSFFTDNVATSGTGGGVHVQPAKYARFTDCTFARNKAGASGGGLYSSFVSATGCTFADNLAATNGGGVCAADGNNVMIDCVISGNSSGGGGGGLWVQAGVFTIVDPRSSNALTDYGKSILTRCRVTGNTALGNGGGICSPGTPRATPNILTDCLLASNSAGGIGGGMYVIGQSFVTGCTFSGNSSSLGGGLYSTEGKPLVDHTRFIDNSATGDGGGAYILPGVLTAFTNCLFARNSAGGTGGGLNSQYAAIANCTFADNAASACGGIYSDPQYRSISNTILWGNSPDALNAPDLSPLPDYLGIVYSCITGGAAGTGNTALDPLFDVLRPYHLTPPSPCINTGDPGAILPDETDLEDRPRILQGRVDMGCYEYNPLPVANAGPDQILYADHTGKASVTLDGSSSSDPEGQPLTYLWTWSLAGQDCNSTDRNFTLELPVGTHVFTLVVNDSIDNSEPDTCTITVVTPVRASLLLSPRVLNGKSRGGPVAAMMTIPDITKNQLDPASKLTLWPFGLEASRQLAFNFRSRSRQYVIILAWFDRQAIIDAVPRTRWIPVKAETRLTDGRYVIGQSGILVFYPPKQDRR